MTLLLNYLQDYFQRKVISYSIDFMYRTAKANWSLSTKMTRVNRDFNKVRNELADVGLLYTPDQPDDGGYLDQIDLVIQRLPSMGEAGFVYERLPMHAWLLGYREGVIYLPVDLPRQAYVPGGTLIDVIRHEFAHAWHWLEPSFFETGWFERAFHGSYEDVSTVPYHEWLEAILRKRTFVSAMMKCRNETEETALLRRVFRDEFVSEYASTLYREDFAETFMTYLRHRNSLERFKSRPGVYRKLIAVGKAVAKASRELGL